MLLGPRALHILEQPEEAIFYFDRAMELGSDGARRLGVRAAKPAA